MNRNLVILLVVSQFAAPGSAQVIRRVGEKSEFPKPVNEWGGPAFSFNRLDEFGKNPIWISQDKRGLLFSGSSGFSSLDWAQNRAELAKKARLEIWLSLAGEIEMPPVGYYGNQLLTEDDCDSGSNGDQAGKRSCIEWLKRQSVYRENLKGLFTRMWRIAPDLSEEAYATPIYDSLTEAERTEAAILKPSGRPVAKFKAGAPGGFEVLIPWEAFPPGDRLHLERVRLALNLMFGDQAQGSTQPPGSGAPPAGLRTFGLAPPVVAHFTPCEYPSAGGSGEQVFCFFDQSLSVRQAFTFENGLACCGMISLPPAGALSPKIAGVDQFVQKLGPGEFLCGPQMAYRKGSSIKRFPFEMGPGPDRYPWAALPSSMPVFRLPNGTRLIQDGPSWSSQKQSHSVCAGCPWATFTIYALTPAGDMQIALSLSGRVGESGLEGYDIERSANWSTVTEFNHGVEKWTSTTYCLRGAAYHACGKNANSGPPKHGLFPAAAGNDLNP